jgi:hypothetical protein
MDENNQVEIEVQVGIPDATEEEVDQLTRRLLLEIRDLDVESAELTGVEHAPIGAKGDPVTLGSIAIAVLPSTVPSVIALVQAWATRGKDRTVKYKCKDFEFEGSPEELHKLLAESPKGRKKK